jgi:hypothetical protein
MSQFLIEELETSHEQVFTATKRINVAAITPWIYKHLSPAGTFTMEITQGSTTWTSTGVTSADIEANSDATPTNYFHGYYRFDFSGPIVINPGSFTVRLNSSGYTFSESAYIGWVKPHENKLVEEGYTLAPGSQSNAFGFIIYKYGA